MIANTKVEPIAMWVYGSYARQEDYDSAASDIDVLVIVSDNHRGPTNFSLTDFNFPREPDISVYTCDGLERLISPPTLFATHLKLEGRPIFDRGKWLESRLKSLLPYANHTRDIRTIKILTEETRNSILEQDNTICFEAGVLAAAIRNSMIILSHFLGKPYFSKKMPSFIWEWKETRFPLTLEQYLLLTQCRQSSERGGRAPKILHRELVTIASLTCEWISFVEDFIKTEKNNVSAPFFKSN